MAEKPTVPAKKSKARTSAPSATKPAKAARAPRTEKPAKPAKPRAAAKKTKSAASEGLAREIAALALEKKATDVLLLDLRDLSSACDFFVIASGGSEQQVRAIGDHVEAKIKETRGERPWHVEGRENRRWVLLDYVHVVLHIFHPETREYYLLERLWADAPREEIKDEPPKRAKKAES